MKDMGLVGTDQSKDAELEPVKQTRTPRDVL
jgi:hypothetical protein